MSGRDYLAGSGLANAGNFFELNPQTLRSIHYPNVWGLGDGSNLPTSKTMSGVVDQINVLEQNLVDVTVNHEGPSAFYDGYTGCPVLTGNNKVLLAEFKYEDKIAPTFLKDQRKPSKFNFFLKTKVFPYVALNWLKHGMWYGRNTFWDNRGYNYNDW